MPTGERGFTYLWLLFVLAIGAAGAATLAQVWSTATQREREREQIFRGEQIAQALWSFQAASGVGPARAPRSLEELVEDRRSPSATRPLRHLRRIYDDPFTGQADWMLERDEQGGITAVRSRSHHPSRIVLASEREGEPVDTPSVNAAELPDAASAPHGRRLSDRRFSAQPPVQPAAAAASAAPGMPNAIAAPANTVAAAPATSASANAFAPYVFRNLFGDTANPGTDRRVRPQRP